MFALETESDKNFKKGQRYFFEKKYSISKQFLEKVLQQKPDHGKSLSLLGDIYLLESNYDQAGNYYRQALEVSSKPAVEHYRLGQIHTRNDKAAEAIKNYQSAYQLDASMKQCLFQLGYVYLVLERNKNKTIENWQAFVEAAPDDAQAEKIKQILELLKKDDFKLPPRGSDIPLAEALLLGGKTITAEASKAKDKEAGHNKAKTQNKTEGLLDDAEL